MQAGALEAVRGAPPAQHVDAPTIDEAKLPHHCAAAQQAALPLQHWHRHGHGLQGNEEIQLAATPPGLEFKV